MEKKNYYNWRECRDQDIVEVFNKLGGEWTRIMKGADGKPKRSRKEKPLCINPAHHDQCGGNFQMDRKKGVFYCQSCGCGGSVIDMVMLAKGCDFQEAIRWIGDQFKLSTSFEPSKPEFEEHEHMLSAEDGALIGLCKSDKGVPYFPIAAPEEEMIMLPETDLEEEDDPFVIIKNPRWNPLRSLFYSDNAEDKEIYYFIVAKKAYIAKEKAKKDWESFKQSSSDISDDMFAAWTDVMCSDWERADTIYQNAMKWYKRYHEKVKLAASSLSD